MNRNDVSYSINPVKKPIDDKNVFYTSKSATHENYWFQDLSNTIFNLDYALKIFPNNDMTYPEKINSIVRLSIYFGLILSLFYKNYLFLYIPIVSMILTYFMYIFRIEQLEGLRESTGPNSSLNNINNKNVDDLMKHNMTTSYSYGKEGNDNFKDILNIKTCSKPNTLNPFMNPLVFDSRLRDNACDSIKEENQLKIEKEYNKHCIKDASDIWNHNSGRREFYTMPNTTYPSNQGAFANWLYRTGPSCKDGNGTQCVGNLPIRLNSSLISPSFSQ